MPYTDIYNITLQEHSQIMPFSKETYRIDLANS